MQVAVGREQVHVARGLEQRVEAAGHSTRGTVSVRGPSTTLTAGPRRRVTGVAAIAVGDELAPAFTERALTQLLHAGV